MHSKAENDRLAPTLDFIFAMKVLNGGFIEVFLFVLEGIRYLLEEKRICILASIPCAQHGGIGKRKIE